VHNFREAIIDQDGLIKKLRRNWQYNNIFLKKKKRKKQTDTRLIP
jgi:hypothetical protein